MITNLVAVARAQRYLTGAWLLLGGCTPSTVYAAETGSRWGLSPVVGVHQPQLKQLNEEAFKAPLIGTGRIRGEPDTPQAGDVFRVPLGYNNDLDPIGMNSNIGLEFQWIQSPRHLFLMGVSSWEGYSSADTTGQLPIQGSIHEVTYDRRAKMSYNEFYFGWKYIALNRPQRYRLYTRLSLNEMFDIDYKEEHVFSIIEPGTDFDGVKRINTVEAQTTGIAAMQLGVGGEYFLKKNLSVGFEAGYLYSYQSFELLNARSKGDGQLGDEIDLILPVGRRRVDEPLGYLPPDTDASTDWTRINSAYPFPSYTNMKLRFDGWKAAFRITLYY